MKKVLLSTAFVTAVFLAITLMPRQPDQTTPSQIRPAVVLTSQETDKTSRFVQRDQSSSRQDIQDKIRQLNEGLDVKMARVADKMTPELRERIWQAHLKRCNTDYGSFLRTLGLDDETVSDVMDIVLERERMFFDAAQNLFRIGMTKGVRDHTETREMEGSLAEIQLQYILDEKQYKMLSEFEKTRMVNTMAKAQEIVAKQSND